MKGSRVTADCRDRIDGEHTSAVSHIASARKAVSLERRVSSRDAGGAGRNGGRTVGLSPAGV